MASEEILRKTIHNADGKPFAKFRNIQGAFTTEEFELFIDEVQGDRTGHTSMRVRVPMKRARFPEDAFSSPSRCVALRDIIARRFWESARTHARSPIPKTDGGEVYMPRPGQEILPRGSVLVTEHYVEASFTADLPSKANKVDEEALIDLIFGRIALIVSESMIFSAYKGTKLYAHLETAENADWIRDHLSGMGLCAFIADGAVLPRRDDDLAPMIDAVPFSCDDSLRVTMDVPNGGPISGMGIPIGYTAITGRSGSGKSVFVDSLFAGIYNHIPGDGREYVISDRDAVYIMAEAGRSKGADRLSGPQSEIAAVEEAIEAGSHLLIFDEEYSSPCIIRRAFPPVDGDLIPVCEMCDSLKARGISVIIVTGDESAIRHADTVVSMGSYVPRRIGMERIPCGEPSPEASDRYPLCKGVSFEKGRKDVSTSAPSVRVVEIGEYKVSVPVAGFFDPAQTREAADAIAVARDLMDGSMTLSDACRKAIETVEADDVANGTGMHHAHARAVDVAAVLNRHPQMLFIKSSR